MSEEKNSLNAYSQFEAIRKAVDQLETIHVYELNARQYGDIDTPSLKTQVAELDKQILEYELQLAELDKMIESLKEANKSLYDTNGKLIEANNKLISEKNLLSENRQLTEDEADKLIAAYKKLPRIVKKFYGVN